MTSVARATYIGFLRLNEYDKNQSNFPNNRWASVTIDFEMLLAMTSQSSTQAINSFGVAVEYF